MNRPSRRRRWLWLGGAGAFAAALVLRLDQQQPGLLYPDGYQYLLMARGIWEHLRPTTRLGPGGDLFVPNADAAAKPLYPALVAAVHLVGASWLTAARTVSATSSAAAVALAGLVAARLARSTAAGVVAALLVLTAPGVVYWSGFVGPDQLGVALALASALALVYGRHTTGGMLAGLACCARPELALVAGAAATAGFARPVTRRASARAAGAALASAAVVLGVLRPPLHVPDWMLLGAVPLVLLAAMLAPAAGTRWLSAAAVATLGSIAGLSLTGTLPGLSSLWSENWTVFAAALSGVAAAIVDRRLRTPAVTALLLGEILVAVYALKNPNQERYFALLLPLAAVLAGMGVGAVARRPARAAVAVAGFTALAVVLPAPAGVSQDMFPVLARRIAVAAPPNVPLVTAARDAYGFWLPDRPVRSLRGGSRGVIVLDAAQRAFAPDFRARGRLVARIRAGETVFVGPRGEIDLGSATLVDGTAVRRTEPGPRRSAASS